MLKVLVWGCGAIGAGYDWDGPELLTHAKAWHVRDNVQLSVCDLDAGRALAVAQRYGAQAIEVPEAGQLQGFDVVSLCVPTAAHCDGLQTLAKAQVPLIVCEKPVVASLTEIESIGRLNWGSSRVMVNYLRRFQPAYQELGRHLNSLWGQEPLRQVTLQYTRGLLNNGSHAWDLLEFFLGGPWEVTDIRLLARGTPGPGVEASPSLYLRCCPQCRPEASFDLFLLGHEDCGYSMFEMEMFTSRHRVSLTDSGQQILFRGEKAGGSWSRSRALQNYMVPVLDQALECLAGRANPNLESALRTNQQILSVKARLETWPN